MHLLALVQIHYYPRTLSTPLIMYDANVNSTIMTVNPI